MSRASLVSHMTCHVHKANDSKSVPCSFPQLSKPDAEVQLSISYVLLFFTLLMIKPSHDQTHLRYKYHSVCQNLMLSCDQTHQVMGPMSNL